MCRSRCPLPPTSSLTVALPGLVFQANGIGEIMAAPVSVCAANEGGLEAGD